MERCKHQFKASSATITLTLNWFPTPATLYLSVTIVRYSFSFQKKCEIRTKIDKDIAKINSVTIFEAQCINIAVNMNKVVIKFFTR